MEERRQTVGMLAATIVNANPFRGKESVSPTTFFPEEREESPEQTPEDHQAMLSGFFARFKRPKP